MAAKDTAAEDESSSSTPTMIGPSSNVQSSGTTTAGTGERETVRNGSHPVKRRPHTAPAMSADHQKVGVLGGTKEGLRHPARHRAGHDLGVGGAIR